MLKLEKMNEVSNNLLTLNEGWENAKEACVEMGQLKTWFDTAMFSVGKENPFRFKASAYHFLIRQLYLAYSEARRLQDEIIEHYRNAQRLKFNPLFWAVCFLQGKYRDIEIRRQIRFAEEKTVELRNRAGMINDFEEVRKELIKLNENKEFTHEQFQQEQPEYYKWFLSLKIVHDVHTSPTKSVSLGTLNACWMASQPSIFPKIKEIAPLVDPVLGTVSLDETIRSSLTGTLSAEKIEEIVSSSLVKQAQKTAEIQQEHQKRLMLHNSRTQEVTGKETSDAK